MNNIENIARSGIDGMHRNVLHPLLSSGEGQSDREIPHERALKLMEIAQKTPLAVSILDFLFSYDDPILETEFAGLTVPNPLGVAAGFDKNAKVHRFLGEGLGFGSITVGSITKIQYPGNERPRIFDLPNSHGVINRMGFPGEGSKQAKKRLEKDDSAKRNYLLIVNFAASKPSFESGKQIEHYHQVASEMVAYGNEGEGNVSSPNTPGVKGLQEPDVFSDIADAVIPVYKGYKKPVRFKFSPDLDTEKLHANARTIIDKGGAGITVTNTTTSQEIRDGLANDDKYRTEAGGISGAPLTQKALEVSHNLYSEIGDEIPIHRAGGIMNTQDVWNALTYGGAITVDVYTAFVRKETSSPNFAHRILSELAQAMRVNGMQSMNDFKELRGMKVPYPLASK